jgi:N-methylhydantoinase B
MRSTKRLVRVDGSEEYIPAKCEDVKVQKGDLLYFNTWGGGGWGDPLQRDPDIVVSDVSKKLVSVEGARRYGVVINDDLSLNQKETESLRAEMSKDTVADEMFNFGGTIEEIKSKSLEETHLVAPVSPTFLNQ